jgi:hypothetical protein
MTIPLLEACTFDVPPVPATVVCFHPDADDCFNINGIGRTRQEAYTAMLDELYEYHVDRFDSDEEADAFHHAICHSQRSAREDSAAGIEALASDTVFSEEVPF